MLIARNLAVIIGATCGLFAGPALADDVALNKEGFWSVARSDPPSEACMASVPSQEGGVLVIQAAAGEVSIAVGGKSPMRRGKQGVLSIDENRFAFELVYNDERDVLFQLGALDERAVAALKLAQGVDVIVDGKTVFSGHVASTGIDNAVDAVVACSKGEKGWWGEGAVAGVPTPVPDSDAILNKEGVWSIVVSDHSVCVAQAQIDERFCCSVSRRRAGSASPSGRRVAGCRRGGSARSRPVATPSASSPAMTTMDPI